MDLMRRDQRFTDVVLVADGIQFPAHRAVLCSCSPYFDRMFQPGFLEQDNKEVPLKDFDSDTLSSLMDFMYTAQITVTEENAQDLLIGANLLLLYEVKEAAGEVLSKSIDDYNVLLIRSLGSLFSCREVESRAHNFMLERFEHVCKTDEFLKLAVHEVEQFLGMDDIIVKSEESIFQCILRWIQQDPAARVGHFDRLVQCVRFPLMTDYYLETEILTQELVQQSPACQQLIQAAQLMRRRRENTSAAFVTEPFSDATASADPVVRQPQYRGSNQLLFLQCSNTSPWLETPPVLYDFKKLSWSSLSGPQPPCRYREDCTFVFHHGSVLSIGGEYTEDRSDGGGLGLALGGAGHHAAAGGPAHGAVQVMLDRDVYVLSLEDRIWSVHSTLNIPRKRHQTAILGGKCYVLGGYNVNSQPLDSVEVLDLDSDGRTWQQAPPMLSKRVSHGTVVLNGSLYVVGGWDGQGVVRTVERFNPQEGRWTEVSHHQNIRMKSGVATLDGKLYVVGGCLQTLESCYRTEVFDPITREWTRLADTKHARANPVLVPYRGNLYLFGGEGNSQGMVECFDPYLNTWTVQDTRIKHFVNGSYAGCLVDKPWDWDFQQSRQSTVSNSMKRILSGVGLDVVQNIRSHWYSDIQDHF